MNVELFEQVRDHIGNNPGDYNQGDWCRCISGHALILAGVAKRDSELSEFTNDDMIQAMLGISKEQADSLVWLRGWPEDLRMELIAAFVDGDKRRQAQAAVERISRFLTAEAREMELSGACASWKK